MPKTTTDKTKPEDAVRNYMLYLDDPRQLIDADEVEKATKDVAGAIDPIDKLKAFAALDAATNMDEAPLREGFVAHAKAWSEEAGVPWKAFTDLKVPPEVLRAAGFDITVSRPKLGGAARLRAKAVPVEAVKAHVLTLTKPFQLAEVIEAIGSSQATVRGALDELVASGQVEKLGPTPDYTGRGRAPHLYQVKPAETPTPE